MSCCSGRFLPTLPLRQYLSLEAFVSLLGGVAAADSSSAWEQTFESLAARDDFFPLLQDAVEDALFCQRKALELERHLQLEQMEVRLNALQREEAEESGFLEESSESRESGAERLAQSFETELETQLLAPQQQEVQELFCLPAFCEGTGLPGCTCCGSPSAAAWASAAAGESVSTALPRLRSRLLADLQVVCTSSRRKDEGGGAVRATSLARLLALGGSRRINPAEAAEALFLECLHATAFT